MTKLSAMFVKSTSPGKYEDGHDLPPPQAVERHAEALFRVPISSLGPEYYEIVQAPLTGTNILVPFERHPDIFAELLRWGACEAEMGG